MLVTMLICNGVGCGVLKAWRGWVGRALGVVVKWRLGCNQLSRCAGHFSWIAFGRAIT